LLDFCAHLGGDLGRVRRAGAEDNLSIVGKMRDGVDQMRYPFLARDAADEQDVGVRWIDAIGAQGRGFGGLLMPL
jgi:hypothetical protein